MNQPRVEFYRHHLGDAEKARILAALDDPILTTGRAVQEAEAALADYLGTPHVVALDSCTAALHLALLAHDIGPSDEVIVPAMTFVATANAALMAGATPVFADVDPVTGCLTAESAARHITPRTRAIMPVHLYGQLCDMVALRQLADDAHLILIEDSAHCIEARNGAVRPASHGHCACLSFYATKNITCGEGGALVTHDAELAERVRRLALHGITSTAYERYGRKYKHWDMPQWGWKYNLDNIRASLLLPQIERLDERWQRRQVLAARYEGAFRHMPGVQFPEVADPDAAARHLFPIWVPADRRDAILNGLQAQGIDVVVNYRAVHLLRYYAEHFGYRPGDLPVAEAIGDRTLSLPFYTNIPDADVERVIEAVHNVMRAAVPSPA